MQLFRGANELQWNLREHYEQRRELRIVRSIVCTPRFNLFERTVSVRRASQMRGRLTLHERHVRLRSNDMHGMLHCDRSMRTRNATAGVRATHGRKLF